MVAALEGARYNATVAPDRAGAARKEDLARWLTYRARVEPKRIGWAWSSTTRTATC